MILSDAAARKAALTQLDKSLLVEAGAGSGKTSLLAGRIVSLLASGRKPKAIAAVSFTEMAASELLGRVTDFTEAVLEGRPPVDLQSVFDGQLDAAQRKNLEYARDHLGDLTCTTIHGFCQRLLKPYPVEADMDPGAQVLDAGQAALMFGDVFDEWIRAELDHEDRDANLVSSLVAREPDRGIALIRELATKMKMSPDLAVEAAAFRAEVLDDFIAAVDAFRQWCGGYDYEAEGHSEFAEALYELSDAVRHAGTMQTHQAVCHVATLALPSAIVTSSGGFRKYRLKSKWQSAAPDKKAGIQAFDEALVHYDTCTEALGILRAMAASAALSILAEEIAPMLDLFRERKREAAALDFEDLLVATRRMLSEHPSVTKALASRYTSILVDEFQDTDPIQSAIFLMLAFDRSGDQWVPGKGTIFLVGDPKQAIYRFRGADVNTYLEMRKILETHEASSILQVSTNFRSTQGILGYVNSVFEDPLSLPEQPGFTALDHHRDDVAVGPAVARFDVPQLDTIAMTRGEEAKRVADICKRLIGSYMIPHKTGMRTCQPSDIALLAPIGSDLWRYEQALEEAGISVATQAGKGLFQRQEIHDLIALTRALADNRDRLALGAFLRGPLVGMTDAELLDASHELPIGEEGNLPFLRVGINVDGLSNPILRHAMTLLESLRTMSRETTPHAVLSHAVDEFRVRALLRARHERSPERALANVDRYLEMSRAYSVRGMRAFSDAMRGAWEDSEKLAEGRPDGEAQSVSLITMHSAKGLEWPVVIPVNTMSNIRGASQVIVDAAKRTLTMPFLKIAPADYLDAKMRADGEDASERVRLWYVAATRARDLLVLPEHAKETTKHWGSVVNLKLDDVETLDLSHCSEDLPVFSNHAVNRQDAASFIEDERIIRSNRVPIIRVSPSRHERSVSTSERLSLDELIMAEPVHDASEMKVGSAERGTIIHKLIEEVLTGETEDNLPSLAARSIELTTQVLSMRDGADGPKLDAAEIADGVRRTLSLPEIIALRPRLFPEVATTTSHFAGGVERSVSGIIDAAEVMPDGKIRTVVDWKSDVRPSNETIDNYRQQVRDYMRMNGAEKGLIVFVTSGRVVEISA